MQKTTNMQITSTVEGIRNIIKEAKRAGKTIGFVLTMGYLHEGHLSLLREAKKECDFVVLSIFVNEKQFGPDEDLNKYPRDIERDKALSEKEGVDAAFIPSQEEIYPKGYSTSVLVESGITGIMCSASRLGHFDGVTTVVSKLFNIVSPNKSYFGQKDYQQAFIIKKMVKDLDLDIDIRVMPVVREQDGLAMSSRNVYLSETERKDALKIYGSLRTAEDMLKKESTPEEIKNAMKDILTEEKGLRLDYIEILDADTLEEVNNNTTRVVIAVAAYAGQTRLIDNVIVNCE